MSAPVFEPGLFPQMCLQGQSFADAYPGAADLDDIPGFLCQDVADLNAALLAMMRVKSWNLVLNYDIVAGTYTVGSDGTPTYTWGGATSHEVYQAEMTFGPNYTRSPDKIVTPFYDDESEIDLFGPEEMDPLAWTSTYNGDGTVQWFDTNDAEWQLGTHLLLLPEDGGQLYRLLFNFAASVPALYNNGRRGTLDAAIVWVQAYTGREGFDLVADFITFLGKKFPAAIMTKENNIFAGTPNSDNTGGTSQAYEPTSVVIKPATYWEYGGLYDGTTGARS